MINIKNIFLLNFQKFHIEDYRKQERINIHNTVIHFSVGIKIKIIIIFIK